MELVLYLSVSISDQKINQDHDNDCNGNAEVPQRTTDLENIQKRMDCGRVEE